MEELAQTFIKDTYGALMLHSGDYDGDGVDDLFIINNGLDPMGYQYLSGGAPRRVKVGNGAPILHLLPQSLDFNNDGREDLIYLTRGGLLYTTAWNKPLQLEDREAVQIAIELSGTVYDLYSVSSGGEIYKSAFDALRKTLDPLDVYFPAFYAANVEYSSAIFMLEDDNALVFHGGDNPEAAFQELEPFVDFSNQKRGDGRSAEIILTSEESFIQEIEQDSLMTFVRFQAEALHETMVANQDDMTITWTPGLNELGFHELNYIQEMRSHGQIQLSNEKGTTVISRDDADTTLSFSHLLYVNDGPHFEPKEVHFVVVNRDTLDLNFEIKDRNVDAILQVGLIADQQWVSHSYTNPPQPEIKTKAKEPGVEADTEPDGEKEATEDEEAAVESEEATAEDSEPDAEEDEPTEDVEEGEVEIAETEAEVEGEPTENEAFESDESDETDYEAIRLRESRFVWMPDVEPGIYPFKLWVNDIHASDSLEIDITVHPRIVLDNNEQDFTISIDRPFRYAMNVEQKGPKQNYTFTIPNAPENMRIDSIGTIYWVPVITQVDDHVVHVTVSDGVDTATLPMTIYVNVPPVIAVRPANKIIMNKGDTYEFTLGSFDANLVADLNWSMASGPHTMTLDNVGQLRWLANEVDWWDYTVQIGDGIDSTLFTNTIYVNDSPEFTSTPIVETDWGDEYTYAVAVQDDNQFSYDGPIVPNELEFSLEESPENMSIDNDGLIYWVPQEESIGNHNITICIFDGIDDVKQSYVLSVDGPPSITSPDSIWVHPGDTVRFNVTVNNFKNADSLQYKIDELPRGFNLHGYKGIAVWPTTDKDMGMHTLKLSVENRADGSIAYQTVKIFVYNLPTLNPDAPTEAYTELVYEYDLQAKDMYGKDLYGAGGQVIIHSISTENIHFNTQTGNVEWQPTASELGDHEYTVEIIDEFGQSVSVPQLVSVFTSPCDQCKDEKVTLKDFVKPLFKKEDEKVGTPPAIESEMGDTTLTEPEEASQTPAVEGGLVVPVQQDTSVSVDSLAVPDTLQDLLPDSMATPADSTLVPLDSTASPIDTTLAPADTSR